MKPSPLLALTPALLCLTLFGCAQPAPEPALAPAAPAPPAAVVEETLEEEEPTSRDLTQLVVCELLPGAEVAAVLGGSLYAEPSPTASGKLWNECSYLVRADPGRQEALLVTVRFYAPEHYELARQLADNVTEVTGVGDEAFSTEEPPLFVLMALQRGDVAVEVRAESSLDDARILTEMVLDRLLELPA